MIILEILEMIFIEILFEGIILRFFKWMGNGFDKIKRLLNGQSTRRKQ